jgi:membrane protein DedA with SNARE-associated domain
VNPPCATSHHADDHGSVTMACTMSTEVTPRPTDSSGTAPAPALTIGRGDIACIGPILAHSTWLLLSLPIGPMLLGPHPLLLSLLRGSVPAMITTGAISHRGDFPLILPLLAPLVVLAFSDPFYYWAGLRYGRRVLDYVAGRNPRAQRRMDWAERVFARYGAAAIALGYFIPFLPQSFLLLAAGKTRMRILTVAVADLLGTFAYVVFNVMLGWYIGKPAIQLADTISHYGLYLTLALVAGVFVVSFRRAMAEQQGPA